MWRSWITRKLNKWVLEQIKPDLSLEANIKTEASYFGHIMRRKDSLEKTVLGKVEGSRRGRPNMRWTDSLKETTGLGSQELSRTAEDRTFWRALIHKVDAEL